MPKITWGRFWVPSNWGEDFKIMPKITWVEVLGSVKLGGGFQNDAEDYLGGGSGFRQTMGHPKQGLSERGRWGRFARSRHLDVEFRVESGLRGLGWRLLLLLLWPQKASADGRHPRGGGGALLLGY